MLNLGECVRWCGHVSAALPVVIRESAKRSLLTLDAPPPLGGGPTFAVRLFHYGRPDRNAELPIKNLPSTPEQAFLNAATPCGQAADPKARQNRKERQ